MKQNNKKDVSVNPDTCNSRENPLRLFITGMDYLFACSEALLKDYGISEEDEAVTVICMAPDKVPYLEFSDRVDLLKKIEDAELYKESYSELMFICPKGNLVPGEDDHGLLLIGPAILFKYDEYDNLCSVSSSDYSKARDLYFLGEAVYEVGPVKIPAIWVGLEGDPAI